MPKILSEQLKSLSEEEEEQTKELAVRALKMLAVRALLRSLAVRALKEKHWTCGQASLA